MTTEFNFIKSIFDSRVLMRILPQSLLSILDHFQRKGSALFIKFTRDLTSQEEIDLQTAIDAIDEVSVQWEIIRAQRDLLCDAFIWRIQRYDRHDRLSLEQIDILLDLDTYMQTLADITLQQDPFNIIWPSKP